MRAQDDNPSCSGSVGGRRRFQEAILGHNLPKCIQDEEAYSLLKIVISLILTSLLTATISLKGAAVFWKPGLWSEEFNGTCLDNQEV